MHAESHTVYRHRVRCVERNSVDSVVLKNEESERDTTVTNYHPSFWSTNERPCLNVCALGN